MINIISSSNKFLIQYDFSSSPEENQEAINLFKKLYLKFNYTTKYWECSEKQIQELLLWIDKFNYEFSISSDAQLLLDSIFKSYTRELEVFRNIEFDYSVLNENQKPFNFQINAINWRLQRSSYLDAFDAGTGKTFINICVFSSLFKKGAIDSIFILVPTGLSYHWKEQILEFSNVFTEDDILIINNDNKIRPFSDNVSKKIIIIPQHLFYRVLLSYKKDFNLSSSARNVRWSSFFDLKKEWNKKSICLVIDESHHIKNTKAIVTKAIFSIKQYFSFRFLLSATPAINRFEDFYSQIKMIDQSVIPMTENAFKLWISQEIGNRFDLYAIVKYKAERVQELLSKMKHIYTQVLKEDIEEIKVKKIVDSIYIEMTPEQKVLYNIVMQNELHKLEEEFDTITWKLILNKLPIICEVLDNPLLLKKRKYNSDVLTSILEKWSIEKDPKYIVLKNKLETYIEDLNEKVVVFDYHPSTLDTLVVQFKKYNPLVIHGSLDVEDAEVDRRNKEKLFNFDPKHKVIFLSALTSSQGINLQHGSHRNIVYTMPWDATLFRQLQDRTHRVNSEFDSIIEVFQFPRTIDAVRVRRNFNRVDLNDRLGKELTKEDLKNLLNGIL